jgi:hypothetical protein
MRRRGSTETITTVPASFCQQPRRHLSDDCRDEVQIRFKGETVKDAYRTSGSSPGTTGNRKPDFHLFFDDPNPTIYLLTPYSKPACAWVAEHIPDDAMWFG